MKSQQILSSPVEIQPWCIMPFPLHSTGFFPHLSGPEPCLCLAVPERLSTFFSVLLVILSNLANSWPAFHCTVAQYIITCNYCPFRLSPGSALFLPSVDLYTAFLLILLPDSLLLRRKKNHWWSTTCYIIFPSVVLIFFFRVPWPTVEALWKLLYNRPSSAVASCSVLDHSLSILLLCSILLYSSYSLHVSWRSVGTIALLRFHPLWFGFSTLFSALDSQCS